MEKIFDDLLKTKNIHEQLKIHINKNSNQLNIFHKSIQNFKHDKKLQLLHHFKRIANNNKNEGIILFLIGSIYYGLIDYEKSYEYFHMSENVFKDCCEDEDNKDEYMLLCKNYQGILMKNQGKYEESMKIHEGVLKEREKMKDEKGIIDSLKNIAMVWVQRGEYEKAMEKLKESLKICKECNDELRMGSCLGNIGRIYLNIGNYEEALRYNNEAVVLEKKTNDIRSLGYTLTSIGKTYKLTGQYDKALEILNEASKMKEETGDKKNLRSLYGLIGSILHILGDFVKALRYYKESLKLGREIKDLKGQCVTLNYLGRISEEMGMLEKSMNYFNESIKICEEIGLYEQLIDNTGGRAILFERLNKFDEAIIDYTKVINIVKSEKEEWKKISYLERRGYLYKQMKNYDGCIADFEYLIKLDPSRKREFENQVSYIKHLIQNPNDVTKKETVRYAFIVGNTNYDELEVLPNCKNDAENMEKLFGEIGFDYVEKHEDLTAEDLDDKICEFIKLRDHYLEENPNTRFITCFYYSGHGIQKGSVLLCPTDFKKKYLDLDYKLKSKIVKNSMSVEKLKRYMKHYRSQNVLYLDCCRVNIKYYIELKGEEIALGSNNLISMAAEPGRPAFSSFLKLKDFGNDENFPSKPLKKKLPKNNSPYTFSLLKNLKKKNVNLEQILKSVKNEVVKLTNGFQNPWYLSDLVHDLIWNEEFNVIDDKKETIEKLKRLLKYQKDTFDDERIKWIEEKRKFEEKEKIMESEKIGLCKKIIVLEQQLFVFDKTRCKFNQQ